MDRNHSLSCQVEHVQRILKQRALPCSIFKEQQQAVVITTCLGAGYHRNSPEPLETYITFSDGLTDGESVVINITTALSQVVTPGDSLAPLAAFLNQLSCVMPLFSFQLDMTTQQVLIRQLFLCAHQVLVNIEQSIDAIRLITPHLPALIKKLTRYPCTVDDARVMADFLSDTCYQQMDEAVAL